jgi:Tol biopolymer transport system component
MLAVVDVATGHTRDVRRLSRREGPGAVAGAQLGWSPDGRLIAVKSITDTLVVDLRGHLEVKLRQASLVNGSQSWSPDGGSLLLYDTARSVYRVADVRGGGSTDLTTPAGVTRALGWAGERIVWLAGSPGTQRLVTTDRTGHDEAPWTRLDVGDLAVASVTWSRALSG